MLLFGAVILALVTSGVALYRYGDIQRQNPLVTIAVWIAWCFSLLIVFTIPLDVTNTVYRQCVLDYNSTQVHPGNKTLDETCQRPWGMVSDEVFPTFWRIIYWSSQFLTWLLLPLLQSYLRAGDFTVKGKLRSSLVENLIYYGTYLLICIVLLVYLALQPNVSLDWPKLKAIASSASNTWGLFLLILLLGYTLVEVPRNMWNDARPEFKLKYAYFKVSKLSSEKSEAEEKVDEVLESVNAINRSIPQRHPLRPCVEEILRKIPTELFDKYGRQNFGSHNASGGSALDQSGSVPSEKSLIRLHYNVIKALEVLQRTEALWNVQVKKVFHLQNVVRNMESNDRHFKTEFKVARPKYLRYVWNTTTQWYWECKIYPPLLKGLCAITAALSLAVVWSEVTFFSQSPVLSIFALVINAAKATYHFVTIEIFSMVVLGFMCYCAFSAVFQIKFLNLYYLAPHHQTNQHSLIFCGTTLCRLTAPMCLNFLGMIHMDSHIIKTRITETYYTQVMGHLDVLPIISNGFNVYFPMLMVALCLATWYSLGSRALNVCGIDQFMIDDQISTELIEEGKELIGREKRKRQRAEEALQRRANLTSTQLEDFGGMPGIGNSSSGGGGGYRLSNTGAGGSSGAGGGSVSGGNGLGRVSGGVLSPRDGLLREGDSFDYATRNVDLNRSLSDEINIRFGPSTDPGRGHVDDDGGYDDHYQKRRNLFDDV